MQSALTVTSAREALSGMVATCERMARQADRLNGDRSPDTADYLSMAAECEQTAAQWESPGLRRRMLEIADHWRRLARTR